MRVRQFGRTENLGVAGGWFAIRDVLPDRPVEKNGFLQYEADLTSQRSLGEAPDIDAVDFHYPRAGVVKPRNQADDCRLTRPGWTNERGELPWFNSEAD